MSIGPIKLRIPEPCHEDWNKMTPKDQGSFCSSCSKVVVDFTKMSDREVLGYLQQTKDQKTCGRFSSFQLNRSLVASEPAPSYYRQIRKLLFGFLLGLGLPSILKAEIRPSKFSNITDLAHNSPAIQQVSGRIIDASGNALAGVALRLYLNGRITRQYVVSDSEGKFSLKINANKLNKNLELRIATNAYLPVNITLGSEEYLEVVLYEKTMVLGKMKIEEIEIISMGDVAMEVENEKEVEKHLNYSFPEEISGVVVNDLGEPIPLVDIRIEDSELQTNTNKDGCFVFELSEELRQRNSFTITSYAYAYQAKETLVLFETFNKDSTIIISLEATKPNDFLIGQVVYDSSKEEIPPAYQKVVKEPNWKEKGFKSRREHLHYLKMNPE